MPRTIARRQILGDSILKQEHPDRVALHGQEIGDGRRRRTRVVALAVRSRAIAHRSARIDDQIATEVRLVLEALHVIAIRPGEETPVEVAWVVARAVFTVLAEL